jgi:hypothetical protein
MDAERREEIEVVPELTTCHRCRSTNTVQNDTEMMCRDCGEWSSVCDHPSGCFYGTFGGYFDAWHIPKGSACGLPHGEDAIHLV